MSEPAPQSQFDASGALNLLEPGLDVLVKRPKNLPMVRPGSDLDVFSLSPGRLLAELRRHFRPREDLHRHLLSVTKVNDYQWHLDLISESKLLLVRFDIYGATPEWAHFQAKDSLLEAVVTSSLLRGQPREGFPVPDPVYEAVVRHFEQLNALGSGSLKDHHTT